MSSALKRITFLVLAVTGGIRAALGFGASPAGGKLRDVCPENIEPAGVE